MPFTKCIIMFNCSLWKGRLKKCDKLRQEYFLLKAMQIKIQLGKMHKIDVYFCFDFTCEICFYKNIYNKIYFKIFELMKRNEV